MQSHRAWTRANLFFFILAAVLRHGFAAFRETVDTFFVVFFIFCGLQPFDSHAPPCPSSRTLWHAVSSLSLTRSFPARSYVSSLSWYFLVLFGLQGWTSVLLGDTANLMDAQMAMMTPNLSPTSPDPSQSFQSERENIDLIQHEWLGDAVEQRALEALRRRRQ